MITIGSFVKSNFRSRWTGIVISEEIVKGSGKKANKICEVLVLRDKNGNTLRKRLIKHLNADWLEETQKVFLTEKEINWIPNHTLKYNLRKTC